MRHAVITLLLVAALAIGAAAQEAGSGLNEWRSIGHIEEIYSLTYSEAENTAQIQFYFKPGGESSEGHVIFCRYSGRGQPALELARLIDNDFESVVFEAHGTIHLRGRLIHNVGPRLGYSRVYAEIDLLKAVGKSVTVELTWVMIDKHLPDLNYGSVGYASATYSGTEYQKIIVMTAALPSLPDSITVTNQRIELDYHALHYGSGQIRELKRGMSKTGSTWNLQNKNTGKTWLSGGPFMVGTDCTTIFWSGAFLGDDPQVCAGNPALKSYIEGKGGGGGGWASFAIIDVGESLKIIDGARLKFDYITSK